MVKLASIALVLGATASVATAEVVRPPDPPSDGGSSNDDDGVMNMLGFRFTIGRLPIAASETVAVSLGVGVEHPVFHTTRVFGEYEWLWLSTPDLREADAGVMRPDQYGTGHRIHVGLRRELAGKRAGRELRVFIDGELGGGVALVTQNMDGVHVLPDGLIGLRFGYDLFSRSDRSPSHTFEMEMLVRAIVVGDGAGMLFGLGMAWGS